MGAAGGCGDGADTPHQAAPAGAPTGAPAAAAVAAEETKEVAAGEADAAHHPYPHPRQLLIIAGDCPPQTETPLPDPVASDPLQQVADRPSQPEVPLADPTGALGRAVLQQMSFTIKPGEASRPCVVLTSTQSRRSFGFSRKVMGAIYGEVWRAFEVNLHSDGGCSPHLEEGLKVYMAIKIMSWDAIHELRKSYAEDPLHEIAALIRMKDPGNPHVLNMVEALNDGSTVYLITPYVDGGDMFSWIETTPSLTEDSVKPLFRQIVDGMRYMHSKGICHADLSLENTLIDNSRTRAFIIDFGMSLIMPTNAQGQRSMSRPDKRAAKPSYRSPETAQGKEYDGVKVDVFAAGAILFMMLTRSPPFESATNMDEGYKMAILRGDIQGLVGHFGLPPLSEGAVNLLKKMLAYHAQDRPFPQDILDDPWFSS